MHFCYFLSEWGIWLNLTEKHLLMAPFLCSFFCKVKQEGRISSILFLPLLVAFWDTQAIHGQYSFNLIPGKCPVDSRLGFFCRKFCQMYQWMMLIWAICAWKCEKEWRFGFELHQRIVVKEEYMFLYMEITWCKSSFVAVTDCMDRLNKIWSTMIMHSLVRLQTEIWISCYQ